MGIVLMPILISNSTFHFDADPDRGPDPDLVFTYVGKSENIFDVYLQQSSLDRVIFLVTSHGCHIFNILNIIQKISRKSIA
jgi:hypothetical protein